MRYFTPQGLKKLQEELKERKTKIRKEIAQRLKEAKALGDLSENTEYQTAREAHAYNEGRILELEEIIKNAVLVEKKKKSQKVEIGAEIEVKADGQKQTFIIVGAEEADPLNGKISNESPLGKALLGHQVGDIIEVETPKGKIKYKILSIR